MRLNRKRSFGQITPPWQPAGFDRPAYYQQDDHFFDAHDRQIVRGQTLGEKDEEHTPVEDIATPVDDPVVTPVDGPEMTASEVLASSDVMPIGKLRRLAKPFLTGKVPSNKAAILSALRNAVKAEGEPKNAGMTWDQENGNDTNSVIDLAAWGRGQKDYLFGDVQTAIRARYSKQVSEKVDAVSFLVDEGVIRGNEVRKDV